MSTNVLMTPMLPTPEHSSYPYASALEERLVLFFVFMGVLSLTLGFLVLVDFLPEKPSEKNEVEIAAVIPEEVPSAVVPSDTVENQTTSYDDTTPTLPRETVIDPYPTRLIIEKLDRDVVVLNPEENTVAALDTALLSGVVRHPDSADFLNEGTMFLFGHSSYLPSVMNKNFQAFNGIQNLVWGDTIRVQSGNTEYMYQVDRTYEVSASVADIELQIGKPRLTLVTCDSFGSKSDRFVVEASLVATNDLVEG